MAKFFSGNYGGQLGSTARAAQLIADAGAREGESLREIGSMIKSATDKYGEKRRKEEEKLIAAGAALAAASEYNPDIVKDIESGALGEENKRALKLINDGNADEKNADRLLATLGAMNSAQALKLKTQNARILNLLERTKLESERDKQTRLQAESTRHNKLIVGLQHELKETLLEWPETRERDEEQLKGMNDRQAWLLANKAAIEAGTITPEQAVFDLDNVTDYRAKVLEMGKTKAEVEESKASVRLKKAEAKLANAQAEAKKVDTKDMGAGQTKEIDGVTFYWTGSSLQPIAGQITQADTFKAAVGTIGGDALLEYMAETRHDKTGEINQYNELNPAYERMLYILKLSNVKTEDDLNKLEKENPKAYAAIKEAMDAEKPSSPNDPNVLYMDAEGNPRPRP
jgi:hypothetical protein